VCQSFVLPGVVFSPSGIAPDESREGHGEWRGVSFFHRRARSACKCTGSARVKAMRHIRLRAPAPCNAEARPWAVIAPQRAGRVLPAHVAACTSGNGVGSAGVAAHWQARPPCRAAGGGGRAGNGSVMLQAAAQPPQDGYVMCATKGGCVAAVRTRAAAKCG